MTVSIVVPMLNEADALGALLEHLRAHQQSGGEVILVDGGSSDGSADMARCAGFLVLDAPRGRARQMNTGAAAAKGDVLLFLHADTQLPENACAWVTAELADGRKAWGRFDVQITGQAWMLKVVALMINWRSRISGIATGDQAMFVRTSVFQGVGGFPDQPLMEDIELSRRLKAFSRPVCLPARVITSGRRWEQRGVWRTIVLMWRLRLAYWLGAAPDDLARAYR